MFGLGGKGAPSPARAPLPPDGAVSRDTPEKNEPGAGAVKDAALVEGGTFGTRRSSASDELFRINDGGAELYRQLERKVRA